MKLQDLIWMELKEATRRFRKKIGSKYMPHNGEKEKARRRTQIEKGRIKCD